jgi:DNA-directed RNA polymerase subunit K
MVKKAEKLSKYEMARILGARALQISEGAPIAVKLSEKDLEEVSYDPYRIAKIELEKGKLPIEILLRQKSVNINEEVLKNEAEIVKLEKELKLQDIEDEEEGETSEKEHSEPANSEE